MSALADARAEIEQLLARYAERIDAGDFAGVAALLSGATIATEDGTVIAEGRDQIEALYLATTRRHADGTPRTRHLITNLVVEPDGEPGGRAAGRFVARSCFTVLQATDDVALQPVISGRYRDVVERRADGTWAFVERVMIPELLGDLHDHLLFDPGTLADPGRPT